MRMLLITLYQSSQSQSSANGLVGWLVGNTHQNADGCINSCSLASNLRDESGIEETPIMLRLKHGFYLVVPDAV